MSRAYGAELRGQLLRKFWQIELAAFLIGGVALAALFRGGNPLASIPSGGRRLSVGALVVASGMVTSSLVAVQLFKSWEGDEEVTRSYPMTGFDDISFSNPEALEIAEQVQPFIVKNTDRIKAKAAKYEEATAASFGEVLPDHADELAPQEGEVIVVAEADPQGSQVGTRVRAEMYPLLQQYLGEDVFAMRTISGDISSNGTVAERGFVQDEAEAGPGIPVVAVKGDHDTAATVEQLQDNDVTMPDFDVTDVSELRVVAGNDPAFKTLFGGMVVNETGVSETELGEMLRTQIDDEEDVNFSLIVLFHQPRSVAGFLGISSTADLKAADGRATTPWDDGIPDAPAGTINMGHYHDPDGPWVVWNTDGDTVTWTVVSQLGTSGGGRGEPDVQPVLDAVLDPVEDGQHAAPVLQRGDRAADRVRRDQRRHRRCRDDRGPGRRRASRRAAGARERVRPPDRNRVGAPPVGVPSERGRLERDAPAGGPVLPVGRRRPDRVRPARLRAAAGHRRLLAEPPPARLAEPGLAALPRRPRQGRHVIRYDERGHGLSDWDVDDHSLEARVADLEAVVDRRRARPVRADGDVAGRPGRRSSTPTATPSGSAGCMFYGSYAAPVGTPPPSSSSSTTPSSR